MVTETATVSGNIIGAATVTVAGAGCVPVWKCEQPLNGYEQDGCGNTRANPRCNPPPPGSSLGTTLLVLAAIGAGLVALGVAAGRK